MPKYMIERHIARAGKLSPEELRSISRQLVAAQNRLAPRIQWLSSQVADDTFYCVCIAESEAVVREHARIAGLPAFRVSIVHATIDPATGESP